MIVLQASDESPILAFFLIKLSMSIRADGVLSKPFSLGASVSHGSLGSSSLLLSFIYDPLPITSDPTHALSMSQLLTVLFLLHSQPRKQQHRSQSLFRAKLDFWLAPYFFNSPHLISCFANLESTQHLNTSHVWFGDSSTPISPLD